MCAHRPTRFLAGEGDRAVVEIAVVQRPDADGVARGDQNVPLAVVEDQGELGVEPLEHPETVLLVEREQQLAVRAAGEGIALRLQRPALRAPAVELAVADDLVLPAREGLHALVVQAHDREAVEAEKPAARALDARVVRTARLRPVKVRPDLLGAEARGEKTHNAAHEKSTSEYYRSSSCFKRTDRCASVVPPFLPPKRSLVGVKQPPAPVTPGLRRPYLLCGSFRFAAPECSRSEAPAPGSQLPRLSVAAFFRGLSPSMPLLY